MKNVLIVKTSAQYEKLMKDSGWGLADKVGEADLVLFTGGSDVDPTLYGEDKHPDSYVSASRDQQDIAVWLAASALGIPMVGICRGGQFLNVMNGGKLYQHVEGHAIGHLHSLVDTRSWEVLKVSSTHHQMMREGPKGKVLAVARERLTSGKEFMKDGEVCVHSATAKPDVEVVLYEGTRTLCFQPHPEFFPKEHECVVYFHKVLSEIV